MSISPNVPSPEESYQYETGGGTPRWISIVLGILVAALAGLAYAGYSMQTRLEQAISKAQDQN